MGFAEGFSAGNNAKIQRETLRMQKEQRDQELLKTGYSFENNQMQVRSGSAAEAEQLQAKEAAQLAKALQGKLAAQDTDRAFEDFAYTGDANYLQSALDNNPTLKSAWAERGVHLVSNIDFTNDVNLLANAGLSEPFYDTSEKQEILRKNMYKIYDGKEWRVGLADKAVAETGAMSRLGNRRAEPIAKNQQEFTDLLNGPKVSPMTVEGHKYEKEIMAASAKYPNVPPNLIAAQMHKESKGNPKAVSTKGAGGLMQIMPDTAKELGVNDVHDPAQNIEGSFKYMDQLINRYDGDVKLALAAYNAGPGNVDKYGGVPPFGETQDYVNTVLANFDQGEQFYGRTADDTINTILNHRRAQANAAAGKTNEIVDQDADNNVRILDQKDIELGLKKDELKVERQKNLTKLATESSTATQKDLAAAENFTKSMVEEYGGEDNFFATDFSDPKEYRNAYRNIVKIEALEGTELSEADKKSITDVRQLINLGNPAKELTGAETGLLDATLGNLEKYVSDNVKGVKSKAAYSAFRNSVRNALFGSALTEAEIKSFNDAYGTLGNKLGPALEMFDVALSQVQAKLDSTSNLMNPYSAKVRLGADQDKLIAIRDALQARKDYLAGLQNPKQASKSPEEKKALLDNIFKGP